MMSEIIALMLVIFSGLLAAFSQLLLKKSAMSNHNSRIAEYLNLYVISSYGVLFGTTLINMIALRVIPYKLVPMLGTVSYIFVILLSKLIIKEKIGRKKWIGMILIIVGIVVFNI